MKKINWYFVCYILVAITLVALCISNVIVDYQYKFAVITQFGGKLNSLTWQEFASLLSK